MFELYRCTKTCQRFAYLRRCDSAYPYACTHFLADQLQTHRDPAALFLSRSTPAVLCPPYCRSTQGTCSGLQVCVTYPHKAPILQ